MSQAPAATPLTDADYHAKTKALLDGLEVLLDRWLDEDVVDIDTHRTGGLLELSLPGGSKIVINTQPPLQEIWLATRGGGFHFRYCDGRWLDTKTADEFHAVLSEHASLQAGKRLTFIA
ncbi:iron donor protein CyaY [Paucibacter sp. R3-3]|uniref:Iron-sulfur cluster assembly protein CyaY n=1 Tax=Roseateles agri TaxID=3098619 RepID=A0ABU5DDJ9_9BURK|nr:iron donor protein CyaY [Paucibacter sp. R3-3]MDY0744352.1 iron donor protein CyaY [Paucibacter sp. R3-3]